MSKFSRVKGTYTAAPMAREGAKWQRKVDDARQEIASAEFALAQPWCIDNYRPLWTAALTKAQAKLAKLEAE